MGRLDYLDQYESKHTLKNYRAALKDYFGLFYGAREPLEDLAEKYFTEDRDYQRDVQGFLADLKGRAPKTVRLKLSSIRVFLVENDVELPAKFWKRLRGRVRGSRALTVDKVPINTQLRKIISHLPIHGKALFLTLTSSGMRIGEALSFTPKDIELDADPARIRLRGEYTKSRNPRVTFISREAKEMIGEWLKVRDAYLEAAVGKSHLYVKSGDDPRLFPFAPVTARVMWNNALEKAKYEGQDERTNRHEIHPHVLRKFFRTRLGAIIPVDVVEALMGHEGYLTEVYRRYTEGDLAKFYKQGESALWIFTEAGEVTELRKEVEEQRDQLQTIVNGLTAENLELKSRVSRMELSHTKLEKHIDSLESTVKRIHETLEKIGKRGLE